MVPEMSVQELAEQIASGRRLILVDVRQPEEHEYAALPDSRLIPLNELPQRWQEIRPPEDTLVVVYCHHGVRSAMATHFLIERGIGNAVSLMGGNDAWSNQIDPSVPQY